MKYNLILNPDKDKLSKVTKAIKDNGGYCPCLIEKSVDTKCPCRDKRENNICHCGLYIDPYDKEWTESNFREFPELDKFTPINNYLSECGLVVTSSLEFTDKLNESYECFICSDSLVRGLSVKFSVTSKDSKIAYHFYMDLHCYLEFLENNSVDSLALKVKSFIVESEVLKGE